MEELSILTHDTWLSKVLSREVYCLKLSDDIAEKLGDRNSSEFKEVERCLSRSQVFVYCKIPTADLGAAILLEGMGFNLVEASMTYEKKMAGGRIVFDSKSVRLASLNDAKGVIRIAESNFAFSRFHLDPRIPSELANRLKGAWAHNYFSGFRGEKMVVKVADEGIIGFLLLLRKDDVVTIDLIAVDKQHRGKGAACDLIAFAESEYKDCSVIRAGTQVANISSLRLYEKLGFRVVAFQYVFHYHH